MAEGFALGEFLMRRLVGIILSNTFVAGTVCMQWARHIRGCNAALVIQCCNKLNCWENCQTSVVSWFGKYRLEALLKKNNPGASDCMSWRDNENIR